ncbi:MAG TPA: glycosyltransferase [Candidatus Saccharimonadales bacterium]|nr:glycosyltransferase [Candidatus Saccharimonadales bacterium]
MSFAPEVSIVVPVYNEEANLPELLDRTLATARAMRRSFELILIDDGSRDGSLDLIRRAALREPEVCGVILNRNYGQHAAVMAGLARAAGSVVVTLDADLQNPPEEIPRLLAAIDEGNDVVGSIRAARSDSLFRRVASSLVNVAVQKSTGVMMHDYGCMLRAYRRSVVDAMLQCHERSTFIPVLANSFARRTTEIEVAHAARAHGDSKYGLWRLVRLQFDLLTSMTTFPIRVFTVVGGIVAAVAGFGFAMFLLVARVVFGAQWAAEGVFTLFAVMFFFVGVQLLGLGLLGEYIGRIYHDVRSRPRYFVQEVLGGAASRPAEVSADGERRMASAKAQGSGGSTS